MRLRIALPLLLLAGTAGGVWWAIDRGLFDRPGGGPERSGPKPAPVEVAPVEHGSIVDRRTFSGTLVPRAQFVVAPKVSGRIESLTVDIGDEVASGAVVARLDDDEFEQAVAEAQAEVEVARAQVVLAKSALDVADSTFQRVTELQEREIASGSELDIAEADLRAKRAEVDVADARVQRAEAVLEAARVRLGYTTVIASWSGDEGARVVAQRYLDEGATVRANDPIVTVVDLSTVRAVLFVTERDFARLEIGQIAMVENDAYPGQRFEGHVLRMAPVFEEASRQTRVEVEIDNPGKKLRPGMFVRVEIALGSADDATIVPETALVRRDTGQGVFVVEPPGDRVRFVPVQVGIVAEGRVQVFGEGITGKVITLGQQLLEDGSLIRVPEPLGETRRDTAGE